MNNKFVYCIVLFFTSSLMASEKRIEALIRVKQNREKKEILDKYVMMEIHKPLTYEDRAGKEVKEFGVAGTDNTKDSSIDIAGFSTYKGTVTGESNIFISMDNESSLFQQRIKDCYDVYEKNRYEYFYIHFLKKQDKSEIISLMLEKNQVEQIIAMPLMQKSSVMRSMLIGLGVTGLIAALVYYFKLRSKDVALLGRG